MSSILCLTFRFLDAVPQFHGRGADGEPEWPPSPLRFFQALVSAAAIRWRENQFMESVRPALQWLERIPPDLVVPEIAAEAFGFRMYVPNNSGDLMTASWARGDTETSMAKFRVEKDVRPTNLKGEAVRFLFPLPDGDFPHFDLLQAAARSVTHLGWGIDMVAGDAEVLTEAQAAELPGEVWRSTSGQNAAGLRVPKEGTLDALLEKHQKFLTRLSEGTFRPVPPLSAFRIIGYRRATDPSPRQVAAFTILNPDASRMRSFDPLRRTRDVAGMLRNAVARIAGEQGWPQDRINEFVHGKSLDGASPSSGPHSPDRFQYLPLPTINSGLGRRVESIRRVLITAPAHCEKEIAWIRRALAGAELMNDDGVTGLLTILPRSDWVVKQYLDTARTWTTVTPVILPGYDDPDHLRRKLKTCNDVAIQRRYLERLEARGADLIRKAFRQAGYSEELFSRADFEWRDVGFQAGVGLASRYLPPENLGAAPRYHVRVRFPVAIQGPVAIGSGRFRGFGLFVKEDT